MYPLTAHLLLLGCLGQTHAGTFRLAVQDVEELLAPDIMSRLRQARALPWMLRASCAIMPYWLMSWRATC